MRLKERLEVSTPAEGGGQVWWEKSHSCSSDSGKCVHPPCTHGLAQQWGYGGFRAHPGPEMEACPASPYPTFSRVWTPIPGAPLALLGEQLIFVFPVTVVRNSCRKNANHIKQISGSRVGSVAPFLIHTMPPVLLFQLNHLSIPSRMFSKSQHLGTCKH